MGIVERTHRHLIKTSRSLLLKSKISRTYQVEDFLIYTINRLPFSNTSNKSPFEILIERMLDYSYLRVFRTLCFPLLLKNKRDKFSPTATKCYFVDYSTKKSRI